MVEEKSLGALKQLSIVSIVLAVIGLGISIYSTQHHLEVRAHGESEAFCNINQTFSCDEIASSAFSEDPYGNPLGVYGSGYFLGLIVLLGLALGSEKYRRDALHGYAVLVGIGAVASVVLGLISFFVVGTLCLTCIGIYLACFLLAGALYFSRSVIPGGWSFKTISNGSTYVLMTVLLSILIFQIAKPAGSPELTLDEPRSMEQLESIMEQMEAQQRAMERNQERLRIDRSQYSGYGEDYRKGSDDARVVIVKFADFQCPSCAQSARRLDQIYQEFGNQIQIVYKNFPLSSECNPAVQQRVFPHTCEASIMARCAGLYDQFWKMHDKIFQNQSRIDPQRLELWALEVGLTPDQIAECRESQDILDKIRDDARIGNELGITGTPTIFVNGMRVEGSSVDQLRFQISNILSR